MNSYTPNSHHQWCVTVDKQRIDLYLAHATQLSRTYIQELIERGLVTVNKAIIHKSSFVVFNDMIVELTIPGRTEPLNDIALVKGITIISMHDDFVIINKPAGLLTHTPHRKSNEYSIAEWVISNNIYQDDVGADPRPGIVHRLDKDTSGIMIIARNRTAHKDISNLFQSRTMQKTYSALVHGKPPAQFTVEGFITRDPFNHQKMCHVPADEVINKHSSHFKHALTNFTTIFYNSKHTISQITASPLTGRTHQIRVHASSKGFPIVGDAVYGNSSHLITRQALHAQAISFTYKGIAYRFEAPIPNDMTALIP